MMKDGFTRTNPYPVHLEATTAKSRDVYAHFKFEVRIYGLCLRVAAVRYL